MKKKLLLKIMEVKIMSNSMLPQYSTVLFTDVWDDVSEFLSDYSSIGIPTTIASDTSATTLFYLLYAKYGNTPIANNDITQFKYKIFSIIFQYGPTWEKKLNIQETIRGLQEADLMAGSKAVYNTALNPSTAPSTGSLDELTYINSQNTTNLKRSKLEAYGMLWEMLDDSLTAKFIEKFAVCFKKFVYPEKPLLYVSEDEEEE
jgi:hypothetical protein